MRFSRHTCPKPDPLGSLCPQISEAEVGVRVAKTARQETDEPGWMVTVTEYRGGVVVVRIVGPVGGC